jgi:hypothetical protein
MEIPVLFKSKHCEDADRNVCVNTVVQKTKHTTMLFRF